MDRYYHSVTLDKDKCVGCTNCLKRCPTEAIRVRGGRAHIIDERCIDCGECIRVCEHHAKIANTNPLSAINGFPYKIALPAPSLYGQFKNLRSISDVIEGLKMMGFDAVYEVARGADIVSVAVMERMKEPDCPRPLISSSCPAVVRLIQTRFPELIDNIVDVRSPMEVAASQARSEFAREKGVDPKDVGCFFITPCAAKMTAIRKPLGHEKSAVDGAISFLEVYGLLSGQIKKAVKPEDAPSPRATSFGIGWARTGGEAGAVQQEESLAVDGIDNVIRVLEEIEDNRLPGLRFFEGMACFGGCIGGPLSFENPFIARNRIRKLVLSLPKVRPQDVVSPEEISGMADEIFCDKPLEPVKVMQLGKDVREALHNMERVEELSKKLPGLDCGSCGSPSCQALAEDIVLGYATEMDCLVLLKERLRQMAHQMVEMSETTRK
ncbi:MAG TPA: 4Fe-4S binding protein [Candidatus Ornithocaccomicrobium faecavium]|uniref:4Fe-4S binding protein n=1 Tax=Candidatus Ornithocaccomicrobium faecavium TaxID=2840890 RepID=A0A9D1P5T8_9FIRM|nr:4Fe-4S binding protein [Candidatus Ornithocaccomicrobium faecavium]